MQNSQLISSLRLPLAILVVAIHSYVADNCLSLSISNVLAHIAVPTFFLISGYLFFLNMKEWNTDLWFNKLKKRSFTLLIPYLLWIILFLLKTRTMPSIADFWCSVQWNFDRLDLWGNPNVASSPILVPMWFIRDLMVVTLLSPIIYFCFRSFVNDINKTCCIISGIIFSFLYFTQTSLLLPGFSSLSLFYFSLGAYLSLNNKVLDNIVNGKRYRIPLYLTFVVLFVLEILYNGHNTYVGNIIYPFWVFVGVLSIIDAFSLANRSNSVIVQNVLSFFIGNSNSSFFIFAFHIFILGYVNRAVAWILSLCLESESFVCSSLLYVFTILITVTICILCYNLLSKFFPRISKLLCGK